MLCSYAESPETQVSIAAGTDCAAALCTSRNKNNKGKVCTQMMKYKQNERGLWEGECLENTDVCVLLQTEVN